MEEMITQLLPWLLTGLFVGSPTLRTQGENSLGFKRREMGGPPHVTDNILNLQGPAKFARYRARPVHERAAVIFL